MNDEEKRLLSNFANRAVGGIPKQTKEQKIRQDKTKGKIIDPLYAEATKRPQEDKQFYEPEHGKVEEIFDKLFNESSYKYKTDIVEKLNTVRKAFFYIFNSSISVYYKMVKGNNGLSSAIYVPKKYKGCPVTVIIWPKDSGLSGISSRKNFPWKSLKPKPESKECEKYVKPELKPEPVIK